MPVTTSANTTGHWTIFQLHANAAEPNWLAGHRRSGTGDDQRKRHDDEECETDGQHDGGEPHFPPGPALVYVVGPIHRPDYRQESRRAAPKRAEQTDAHDAAVLAFGEPYHLPLNDRQHVLGHDRAGSTSSVKFPRVSWQQRAEDGETERGK
jgi:hypothetical protein